MPKQRLQIRQLFDPESSTFTYLLIDSQLKEAVIVDPVDEQVERDLKLIEELKLKLRYVLETHVHADHVTSSSVLRERTGAKVAVSAESGVEGADILVDDGQEFNFGDYQVRAIKTPGHTEACMTFECDGNLFTGDTLLVRKCGRTDFQGGSAKKLFHSVRERLFRLPDHYVVYPGHDYSGFTSSTIGEEKKYNARLALEISEDEFIKTMENLNLNKPAKIDQALPRNLLCGR